MTSNGVLDLINACIFRSILLPQSHNFKITICSTEGITYVLACVLTTNVLISILVIHVLGSAIAADDHVE